MLPHLRHVWEGQTRTFAICLQLLPVLVSEVAERRGGGWGGGGRGKVIFQFVEAIPNGVEGIQWVSLLAVLGESCGT